MECGLCHCTGDDVEVYVLTDEECILSDDAVSDMTLCRKCYGWFAAMLVLKHVSATIEVK